MEKKINIAEILKDKPQGTKLYSSICGAVELKEVIDVRKKKSIVVKELNSNNQHRFWYDGKFFRTGQCVLQPSENMADWSKFAWKKGDVLVSNDRGTEVIFDKWYDETYTSFYCKHYLNSEDENKIVYYEAFLCTTERYSLEDKDSIQTYINTIEKFLGGKLNRETLEIEKPQPEFKDGDIVFEEGNRNYCSAIGVLKKDEQGCFMFDTFLTKDKVCYNSEYIYQPIRLATEEEKKQLFSALEKKGKAWDAEKKQIVDLKPKVEFKPFDKVLIRNYYNEVWKCDFYSFGIGAVHSCIVNGNCKQCIPYNEETAKLIGTTKDIKG